MAQTDCGGGLIMTDNEIKKALECCIKAKTESDCAEYGCPYYLERDCLKKNSADILDLLNRRDAEKEQLEEILGGISKVLTATCAGVRVRAIKEVVERLKENESKDNCQWCNHSNKGRRSDWCNEIIDGHCRCLAFSKFESKLDNLVKEMERENDK